MMTNATITDEYWQDASRVEAWAGEVRVNLIRLIAIVLFYGRHLIEIFLQPPTTPASIEYHTRVTWLTGLWAASVIYLHWRLASRRVPDHLKFAAVAWDAVMITMLCMIAGGPKTPLTILFFPLIATAPLRLSLRLVYVATAAAGAGYLSLLAYYAWYLIGAKTYYAPESAALRIPRADEITFLLAILVSGLFAGQIVRQARRLSIGYPVVVDDVLAHDSAASVASAVKD